MDSSPPGSSVHGIFQARVLEWGAISFSDNKFVPRLILPMRKEILCSRLFYDSLHGKRASLVTQMVKNLPATQEIRVRSLSQEDLLEKGMATPSSILAWKIPWTEEPGGLQSMGSLSWT